MIRLTFLDFPFVALARFAFDAIVCSRIDVRPVITVFTATDGILVPLTGLNELIVL